MDSLLSSFTNLKRKTVSLRSIDFLLNQNNKKLTHGDKDNFINDDRKLARILVISYSYLCF